jgi:hypothetical protein
VVEQGIWRKRSNQEFRELREDLDIVAWTCSTHGSGKES